MTVGSFGAATATATTRKWLGEKHWTPFQFSHIDLFFSQPLLHWQTFRNEHGTEVKTGAKAKLLKEKKIQCLVLHLVKCHMGDLQEEDYHLRSTPSHTITTTLIFMGCICPTRSRDVFSLPWLSIWIINQRTCIPWKHSLSMNPHGNGFVTSLCPAANLD